MNEFLREKIAQAARRTPSGRLARELRRSAGLTQADVAQALGVNRVTVTRWETGVQRPHGELRDRWADLLNEIAAAG